MKNTCDSQKETLKALQNESPGIHQRGYISVVVDFTAPIVTGDNSMCGSIQQQKLIEQLLCREHNTCMCLQSSKTNSCCFNKPRIILPAI